MNIRTIAKIQILFFAFLLFLAAFTMSFIALAWLGLMRGENGPLPGGEALISWGWYLSVANNLFASGGHILITICVVAYQILCLMICKRYANEFAWPWWLFLMTGIIPGLVMLFAWSGILAALKADSGDTTVAANTKWIVISLIAGVAAIVGIYIMFQLLGAEGSESPDMDQKFTFQAVFFGTCGLAILSFYGVRQALREPKKQSNKIIEEFNAPSEEYKLPVCPKCGAVDPVLEGVDPVNAWLCESCGMQWNDSAGV